MMNNPPGSRPPAQRLSNDDMNKLRGFLVGAVTREMEQNPVPVEQRADVIRATLGVAYQQTRLNLPVVCNIGIVIIFEKIIINNGPEYDKDCKGGNNTNQQTLISVRHLFFSHLVSRFFFSIGDRWLTNDFFISLLSMPYEP